MQHRLTVAVAILFFFLNAAESKASHVDCQELHAAAYLDEPVKLVKLIEQGADMECRDSINQTPLITATDGASFEAFSILLGQGANINARDELGQTALDKARLKLSFFDMRGGEMYRDLYRKMIEMLIAAETSR